MTRVIFEDDAAHITRYSILPKADEITAATPLLMRLTTHRKALASFYCGQNRTLQLDKVGLDRQAVPPPIG